MQLLSVNVGSPRRLEHTDAKGGVTGIDKRPVEDAVRVVAPDPERASGLVGDAVCDTRHHGGEYQAVYAYARETLDAWEPELGPLRDGTFGENLTTVGVEVDGALIGERWRVGAEGTGPLLEVCSTRIPCRTFAGWLDERGWIKRFTLRALPGAYLRVIEPGEVRAGDPVRIVHRPDHEVTSAFLFRALTREPELLPRLLDAGEALAPEAREKALKRTVRQTPA